MTGFCTMHSPQRDTLIESRESCIVSNRQGEKLKIRDLSVTCDIPPRHDLCTHKTWSVIPEQHIARAVHSHQSFPCRLEISYLTAQNCWRVHDPEHTALHQRTCCKFDIRICQKISGHPMMNVLLREQRNPDVHIKEVAHDDHPHSSSRTA